MTLSLIVVDKLFRFDNETLIFLEQDYLFLIRYFLGAQCFKSTFFFFLKASNPYLPSLFSVFSKIIFNQKFAVMFCFLQCWRAGVQGYTTNWLYCWETSSDFLRRVQVISSRCADSINLSFVGFSPSCSISTMNLVQMHVFESKSSTVAVLTLFFLQHLASPLYLKLVQFLPWT